MTARILIVEDDADLVRALSVNLVHEGYEIESAGDGAAGFEAARSGRFDLVLLDLMLPEKDGFEVLTDLRQEGVETPVICLTARGQESDVVAGFRLGADDYVVKPFSVAVLTGRIGAVLRRAKAGAGRESLQFGDVRVDVAARRVTRPDGEEEVLTPIETDLLLYLVDRRGAAVAREEILKDLWGLDRFATTRTLDNHVARLRKKIEPDPESPAHLKTVHGVGYRMP
jgi:two-component system alkaline phosphatase synthesis response regulator PhoP